MSENSVDWDAVIDELRRGWCQRDLGPYCAPVGDVCLMGAIARVSNLAEATDAMERLAPTVYALFPDRAPGDRESVPGWPATFNDHPDTTVDDVILVCEKARAATGELS